MKRTLFAAAAVVMCMAGAALAHDYKIGALSVAHPMAFETAKTARTGGGYLSITNTGDAPDRLIGARSDAFPDIMLHETTTDANGVARMAHLDAVEIPAGETVTFAPGGMHLMFMGLDGDPLEIGEKIPVTLHFERAGDLDVVFNVEARGAAGDAVDHATH
jgi:hypothetical protein